MLATYRATLQDDHLQWQEHDSAPPSTSAPVEVLVTVLEQPITPTSAARGRRMVETLRKLSASAALGEITDPAQWEREMRQDRPLPGRES